LRGERGLGDGRCEREKQQTEAVKYGVEQIVFLGSGKLDEPTIRGALGSGLQLTSLKGQQQQSCHDHELLNLFFSSNTVKHVFQKEIIRGTAG
jgi:hypothetical protein